ncbi:hypothetical protein DL769_001219 [Monosporascus sp. CRB-8-3]|nr:hypothetical protein DL769_001219 [Monosporascus sp. CRB-8-3]
MQELANLIDSTAELRMLASAMFDEVLDKDTYRTDPAGNKQAREYNMTEYGAGLIGFPFNAILDWPMGTQSGYVFFPKAEEYDTFWLKGRPYSIAKILNHHEKASVFFGGTMYQGFLSATSYHRWNSPVKGKVVYAGVVDGIFLSGPTITGFTDPDGPDPAAPDQSQGYITHVATRAIFLIET